MAPCNAGAGLEWAIESVLEAYEKLAELPRHPNASPVEISLGSATTLPHIADQSITAIVVDPPYADNVQYSELADFFYVWLKRTQGHRRSEWFSTYLCEHDQEAVVNLSRHRPPAGRQGNGARSPKEARTAAHTFYQRLMTGTFTDSTMMRMLVGLRMPSPDPIGAASGMTAAQPASSSRLHATTSSPT
jgi:adenine-specific DNA methylase